jgi:hypothetical protein
VAQAVRLEDAAPVTATSIAERQNQPAALRAARAFRRRYAIARRWRALRLGVGLALGTVGVLLALLEPSTGEYVAALAAAWIVFSRTVLLAQERREQDAGALAQEVFDVEVFDLPWNAAKAGPAPAPEDLCNWGERQAESEVRDWYPDVGPVQHPLDVLLCQRASLTWARQDHGTYAHVLRWGVGVALLLTVVLGLILGLELGEYLLRLGLPVLPAALDILDIATANAALARSRGQLQLETDSLYARARDAGQPPSMHDCRVLQNEIYATRRVIGVPDWFYRLTRERRQRNMQDVAREQAQRLPATLR